MVLDLQIGLVSLKRLLFINLIDIQVIRYTCYVSNINKYTGGSIYTGVAFAFGSKNLASHRYNAVSLLPCRVLHDHRKSIC